MFKKAATTAIKIPKGNHEKDWQIIFILILVLVFSKLKQHSVNIRHQFKSKSAWAVCTECEVKIENWTRAMTTVENKVFIEL